MDSGSTFTGYLLLWVGVFAWVVARTWSRRGSGAGLVLAYCFQMWLLYWVGAALHSLPWSQLPEPQANFIGFQQATWGVIAFGIGAVAIAPLFRPTIVQSGSPAGSLPVMYIIAGTISYSILTPILGRLPSLNALTAVGQQLVVAGLCLGSWKAWTEEGLPGLRKWLPFTLVLPVVTMVVQGFLGYGSLALATVMIFASQFVRPRWMLLMAAVVMGYLGLSFYVSYMRDRNEIRAAVWGEESYSHRFAKVNETLANLEWFDLTEMKHLERVDDRVNQNFLVGAAVIQLEATGDFARGETIWNALLGIIPRVVWPNKPASGGSGGMVSRFTGISFAYGTSVGIGPVMEFYANFGTAGVVIGFGLLGTLLSALDMRAGANLRQGNWLGFMLYFLIGLGFLQVGGSLVELTSSSVAGAILGHIVNTLFRKYQKIHPQLPRANYAWR